MADQTRFEGLEVAETEFELGNGSTPRATIEIVKNGDLVEGTWQGKVVNVKHPFKSGTTVRLQTISITEAEIVGVVEKYSAPPKAEQPPLSAVE